MLPDAGVLGMVKNLIEKDDKIKPEDKKIALAKTKEMYELEVKDRDSARSREVEVKKTGSKDIMMMLTGNCRASIIPIYHICGSLRGRSFT